MDGARRITWGPRPLYDWRSFQWSGQLTCSKSRDRPGQGFKGQAGSTAEVEVRGTPPSHRGLCVRWEADNPHFSNRVSHLHH